jgi:O-antigen/teichoic acid export membrane protein
MGGCSERLRGEGEQLRAPALLTSAWRHFREDRFYRDSAWVTGALLTVNASNYVLNVALSRILGRAGFGEVAAVLSLLYILNVPTSAIQTMMTREIAQLGTRSATGSVFQSVRRVVLIWAAVATVGALLLSPLVVSFLHLDSPTPALLLGPVLGLALLVPVYRGVLQGRRRFRALTANVGAEALLRVVGAVTMALLGFRAAGVTGAFGGALLAALALGHWAAAADIRADRPSATRLQEHHLLTLLPLIAALGLVTALFNLDVVLARHFLPGTEGGEYAAMSLVARVLFYTTSSVGGVVVASRALARPRDRLRLLGQGLLVVVGVALAGEVVLLVASRPLVGLVFGAAYSAAAPSLPLLGAGMVALATANLLVYFLLAMRRTMFVAVLAAGVALEVVLVGTRHSSLADIAAAFTISATAVLAALAVVVARTVWGPQTIAEDPALDSEP